MAHHRILVVLACGAAATAVLLGAGSRRELLLALNSLYLALAACAIALPLGAILAALVSRTDAPGRKSALFLFAALLFMPLYLQTAAWDAGFGRQGWFSAVLGSLAAPPLEGWRGAIWVHAMAAIPWAALIVAAGLRRAPPECEEAALLEASPAAVFGRITLPYSFDSLGLAALWIFIATVGEITAADMYQVNTYARELYIGFALGEFLIGPGEAEAAASATFGVWPGVVVTGWLGLAAAAFLTRLAHWDLPASPHPPRTFVLSRLRPAAGLLVMAAVVLIAGVPLGNFIYQAGIRVEQIGDERIRSWSILKVAQMVAESPARYSREIFWTSAIGLSSATLAVAIAAPLAWLARRGGWRAIPALAVAVAGLAIPGPLIGLGLIAILNREDSPMLVWLYDRSLFAPIAATLLRALPWAILIFWLAFRSIPAETLESAELDGAGPAARFLRIGAPQRPAAFALAWLLSLVISTGDLAASILVIPPGIDTLPVRIFGLIHAGVDDQVAAICLTIILAVLTAAAIGWLLVKRSRLAVFFSIR